MTLSPIPVGDALFLLSFHRRGELSETTARAGWRVLAARRGEGAARRFLVSGTGLAVLDAREALDESLAVARALGDAARAKGGALLVLVSEGDVGALGDFYAAGATHFLASPFGEEEFLQALRFAWRYIDRTAGGWDAHRAIDLLGWRYHAETRRVRLSPALARRLRTPEEMDAANALRTLPPEVRHGVVAAVQRVIGGGATAFAHDQADAGRLVHHIQAAEGDDWVHGLIEELGTAPDVAAETHQAMASGQNVEAVRAWINHRLDHGEPVSAIIIALSRFDLVNFSYGRIAGDTLIRAARKRIEATARRMLGRGQVVARMKGPEFLIGVENADAAQRLGGALVEALARPFAIDGTLVSVGARVGVASARGGESLEVLLREANAALEGARTSDGTPMRIATQAGLIDGLAGDLRRAIEADEIAVLFQPQVAIGSGRIVGVEALARWDHPELGPLGAENLLAAADRADLGLALSDHIQRVALARAMRWPDMLASLRLSINLTAADIARPGFADILLDRIDVSGFARARLTVEITESGLIDDLAGAAALLAQLRQAGCRVAIDDFGTGYSSLAYLKALPLDYLKIDRRLAQDITGSVRDRVVVRGVIEMARSLGLAVIAEGVETTEQLDLLAKEGCQYYQGFLCAEPLATDALVALIGR